MLGSLGENTLMEPQEKRRVMEMAKEVARGRVQVLSGVSETARRWPAAMPMTWKSWASTD